MGRAKGVVHVVIRKPGQSPREAIVVVGFGGMKTKILKQSNFTLGELRGEGFGLGADAVLGESHPHPGPRGRSAARGTGRLGKGLAERGGHRLKTQRGLSLPLWTAQMGSQENAGPGGQ